MQINKSNYHENSYRNPSFGKVLKFENDFQTYIEKIYQPDDFRCMNKLKAYADFLDTFSKSKPIKDYVAKHDVNIRFTLDSHNSNPTVAITDASLDPNLSRNDVLLLLGEEDWKDDRLASSFKSLTKKIKELPANTLVKRLKECQAQAEKERKRLFDLGKSNDYVKKKISDDNNRIQDALNEIENW